MRKLVLILCATLSFSVLSFAQKNMEYCELVVYRNFLKNYVAEFHTDSNKKASLTIIRDENGNKIKFATQAEALNYITKQGWELVTAFNEHGGSTHFFLKKSK